MSDNLGDDLIAARRFMNLCQANMSEIFSGKAMPVTDVMMRLGDIQSQAKLMHARSIYRSAQRVVEDLTVRKSAQNCVTSVLNLQKLIGQYEAGLSEIAPKPANRKSEVVTKSTSVNTGPIIISDLSAQKEAAKTLGPLVQLADGKDQKNLVRLLSLAANDAPRKPKKELRNFDVIMPNLTNHWLRLARANHKNISVSVAAADVVVDIDTLKALQTGLSELGSKLVLNCVEDPKRRASKSLSESAHLAVTCQTSGEFIDILLSCEGILPDALSFEKIKTAVSKLGGKFLITVSEGVIKAEILRLPSKGMATKLLAVQGAAS